MLSLATQASLKDETAMDSKEFRVAFKQVKNVYCAAVWRMDLKYLVMR